MRRVLRTAGTPTRPQAAASSASEDTASNACTRMPQARKNSFSAIRSCATARLRADGAVRTRAATRSTVASGTFSNS